MIEDSGRPFPLSREETPRCFLRVLSCSGVRGPCRDWCSGAIGSEVSPILRWHHADGHYEGISGVDVFSPD